MWNDAILVPETASILIAMTKEHVTYFWLHTTLWRKTTYEDKFYILWSLVASLVTELPVCIMPSIMWICIGCISPHEAAREIVTWCTFTLVACENYPVSVICGSYSSLQEDILVPCFWCQGKTVMDTGNTRLILITGDMAKQNERKVARWHSELKA